VIFPQNFIIAQNINLKKNYLNAIEAQSESDTNVFEPVNVVVYFESNELFDMGDGCLCRASAKEGKTRR
jgi:hypothetical protein